MFTVAEIVKATGGRLVTGSARQSVKSISIDSRTMRKQAAFIAIEGNTFNGHDFIHAAVKKGAACIIKTRRYRMGSYPGVACVEVTDTTQALGDIARFWRRKFSIPIIAVTGSNGKTTAKDMIAWVLSRRWAVLKNEGTKNNHIGLPMALLGLSMKHDMAVLELGSNHPGEIRYLVDIAQPTIGVITTIGPAHLEHFGTIANVVKEKYALVERLSHPAIAIVNADDDCLRHKLVQKTKKPFILGVGVNHRSDFFASSLRRDHNRLTFVLNHACGATLNTPGEHNIYHALIAAAVGRIFGLDYQEISSRLGTFRFPAGRLSVVVRNSIRFIDDSYNANPESLTQALQTMDSLATCGRKIFIMGDMLELGRFAVDFHKAIGKKAAQVCDAFIAVGKFARHAASAARVSGLPADNIFVCQSSVEAKRLLRKKLRAGVGDLVLVKGSRAMRMEEVLT